MSSTGGCTRWRAGVGVAVVVSALGVGAVGGAAPSMAAPAPAASAAAVGELPGAPTELIAVNGEGKQQVGFDFAVPTTGAAIVGYEISVDNAVTWAPVATVDSTPVFASAPPGVEEPARRSGSVAGVRDDVVYRVAVRALSAAGPGPASQVASSAPRYGDARRLSGPDRVATAITVSQDVFAGPRSARAAVITTSATYADALAGAALAARAGGPLLLTSPTALEPAVAAEIRRVVETRGTIYVLGDTGAVSAEVEKALEPAFDVVRLAGADRYATALEVADQMRALGVSGPVYLATGTNFPDGLAVSALAADTDGLVVLSNDRVLDAGTKAWIGRDDPEGTSTVPVGGPAANAAAISLPPATKAKAIVGADRYDTALRIALAHQPYESSLPFPPRGKIGLATGENWPDALVGAAAMGNLRGPLLLTNGGAAQLSPSLGSAVSTFDRSGQYLLEGVVFGGSDVLPDALVNDFALSLPEFYS